MKTFEHEFVTETVDMIETGFNLRKIREAKKFSVNRVSDYLGISPQAIYNWEIGKSALNINHLVTICNLYDTTFNDLVKTKKVTAVCREYDE